MNRDYLSVEDVLDIHYEQIERYGGLDGVRDAAGLEAAVARPASGYYDDLLSEAAALWESLSQNHAFVDGNKRVAFSAMNRFLRLNGKKITAAPMDALAFINERFEQHDMVFERLHEWLVQNTEDE